MKTDNGADRETSIEEGGPIIDRLLVLTDMIYLYNEKSECDREGCPCRHVYKHILRVANTEEGVGEFTSNHQLKTFNALKSKILDMHEFYDEGHLVSIDGDFNKGPQDWYAAALTVNVRGYKFWYWPDTRKWRQQFKTKEYYARGPKHMLSIIKR